MFVIASVRNNGVSARRELTVSVRFHLSIYTRSNDSLESAGDVRTLWTLNFVGLLSVFLEWGVGRGHLNIWWMLPGRGCTSLELIQDIIPKNVNGKISV